MALINSATGWVDIENEEMDSTAIEQALEADARRGVNVRVTMTADPAWTATFTRLTAAGVHIRLYDADAPLYIHAKMILTPAAAFLGSQNFSSASMNENRELGTITTNPTIRASLAATSPQTTRPTPFTTPAPTDSSPTATSTTPPGTGTSGCTLDRLLQHALRRLRRLRPLKRIRRDSDVHRHHRPYRHLAHRQLRLRRRLPENRRTGARRNRDRHDRRRALQHNPVATPA